MELIKFKVFAKIYKGERKENQDKKWDCGWGKQECIFLIDISYIHFTHSSSRNAFMSRDCHRVMPSLVSKR